eukprot:11378343-Alexandrium_andersonii.AAC.1
MRSLISSTASSSSAASREPGTAAAISCWPSPSESSEGRSSSFKLMVGAAMSGPRGKGRSLGG